MCGQGSQSKSSDRPIEIVQPHHPSSYLARRLGQLCLLLLPVPCLFLMLKHPRAADPHQRHALRPCQSQPEQGGRRLFLPLLRLLLRLLHLTVRRTYGVDRSRLSESHLFPLESQEWRVIRFELADASPTS